MSATRQALFEVPFISGSVAGVRHVWAPDAQTAADTLEQNPALHGIPHETVIVGRAKRVSIRIQDATGAAVHD